MGGVRREGRKEAATVSVATVLISMRTGREGGRKRGREGGRNYLRVDI